MVTFWPATSWVATDLTVFTGIAKPTPSLPPDSLSICELTPMTLPLASSSGPPELPWLIAASVWIAFAIGLLLGDVICAAGRADDAGAERVGQAERAADGEHRPRRSAPSRSHRG